MASISVLRQTSYRNKKKTNLLFQISQGFEEEYLCNKCMRETVRQHYTTPYIKYTSTSL